METENKMVIRRVRNFGDIIADTFNLIRQGFKPLGKACLYVTGPMILIVSLISGFINAETMSLMFEAMKNPADMQKGNEAMLMMFQSKGYLFGAGYVIIIALSFIIISLFQSYSYEYMVLYNDKDPEAITYKDIITGGGRHVVKLFFTNIGIILLFTGAVFFLIIFSSVTVLVSKIFAAFIPVLLMVFMFAGFYFMIMFILTPAVRVFESAGFWTSLMRSFKLMYGNFWNTIGLLIVLMIAMSIIGFVFMIPYFAVYGFLALSAVANQAASPVYIKPVMVLASSLPGFATFLNIILIISIGFKYYSLLGKKEWEQSEGDTGITEAK